MSFVARWLDLRFDSHRVHGYVLRVLCVLQVEVSTTDRSLIQSSPTDFVCVNVIEL